MLPSLKLLAELHFDQILVVLTGYILSNRILRQSRQCFASIYTLGFLWFGIVGGISLVMPRPRVTIWALTIILCLLSIRRSDINLHRLLRSYFSVCIIPFLIFLPFAIFFLAHFSSAEIASGIDPWLLIDRTLSYRVPDHYLQWTVSNNFYDHLRLETGFNLNGKQMWSAGDRPVFIGLLESTFSHITKHRSFTLYYLRVIFIASLLFTTLFTLLKEEFAVTSYWIRVIILAFIALHPFFLINVIFTWPKMAGLAFGMMGFLLLSKAIKEYQLSISFIAGIAFALGIICHTAAVFCFLAAILYFPIAGLIKNHSERLTLANSARILAALILPMLLLTQIHSRLLSKATKQTNLLARVQLCRGGSYAFVTPVESVYESCKKYLQREGISGAIEDRRQSIQRAFDLQAGGTLESYYNAISGKIVLSDYLKSLNMPILLIVPYTIGHFSLYFLGFFILLYLLSIKFSILKFSNSSLLLPIGFSLLLAFCCMLGEYTEMSSHVVPYIAPLFIHLGILLELSRLSKTAFTVYSLSGILISLAILFARAGMI